jgi:hypothetical protein
MCSPPKTVVVMLHVSSVSPFFGGQHDDQDRDAHATAAELVMSLLLQPIDGLKSFARSAKSRDQTRELVSRLVGTCRQKPSAPLKFLFAGTTRSEFVQDLKARS